MITITTFGYKYRRPYFRKGDMVFDARVLRNISPALVLKSALDPVVMKHVVQSFGYPEVEKAIKSYILQHWHNEDTTQSLRIWIGCTYGKHRSRVLGYMIQAWLDDMGVENELVHREK
jgi:RNase adaptor protein for sRNA GlmZ degradation